VGVKVLVTCIPQAGHLTPMMPVVSALAAAGHDVVVASGETVRSQVESAGLRFEAAGHGLDHWFGQLAARTRGAPGDGLPPSRITHYFVPRLFAEIAASDMVDDVLAVGERLRPDLVVFDTEAYAGPLVAALLGARQAHHLFGPLPARDVTQLATDALSPLWRSFGLDVPAEAGLYDGTTVAICPPSMDPETPSRGTLLRVRPAPAPLRPVQAQTPPLVYFSLGTMWADAGVVRTVLDGLAELPVRVVATLGALDPADVPTVPANAELHRFVPQQQVLPDASVVVHHAGAGTMFGALAHGVPQVALPQAADNFVNAGLLARSGAGVVLGPAEVTSESVAQAVRRLLGEPSYARSARAVADEVASMPAADEVAAALAADPSGGSDMHGRADRI
jgi:UDP:flavonoid glycosyltransferase YjiC (YdhE family)